MNEPTTFIPSPCIGKCGLNDQEICRGCFRHIDEIMQWKKMSEIQKQETISRCHDRRQQRITQQKKIKR